MQFVSVSCSCAVCTWSRRERARFFFFSYCYFWESIFNLDITSPFCEVGSFDFSFARTQNSEVGVVKRTAY